MDASRMEQLKILATPLNEFLKENFNPHCRIVINFDGAKVVEDVLGVPHEEAHS